MEWLHTWNGLANWSPMYDSLGVLLVGTLGTWLVIALNGRKNR